MASTAHFDLTAAFLFTGTHRKARISVNTISLMRSLLSRTCAPVWAMLASCRRHPQRMHRGIVPPRTSFFRPHHTCPLHSSDEEWAGAGTCSRRYRKRLFASIHAIPRHTYTLTTPHHTALPRTSSLHCEHLRTTSFMASAREISYAFSQSNPFLIYKYTRAYVRCQTFTS